MGPNVGATEAEAMRHRSALRIQCMWRRVRATRRVKNIRLWRWITNRNTVKIQCAWRQHVARHVRQSAAEYRAIKLEILHRNVHARSMTHIKSLVHWRGSLCAAAAAVIQTWYRLMMASTGNAKSIAAENLARAVKEMRAHRSVVISTDLHL